MGKIEAGIKSVEQMFNEEGMQMQIPPYQRPYRWGYKNVKQLLEDITTNTAFRHGKIHIVQCEVRIFLGHIF